MTETEIDSTVEDKTETRGRKKIELDVSVLSKLAEIQCNLKEMAYIMGCSVETLKRNYEDVIELGKANGKVALRRAQFRKAIDDGNPTMLIWLGKQVLGQSDQPINDDDNQILPWSD